MVKTKQYTVYIALIGPSSRHVFKIASLAVTWDAVFEFVVCKVMRDLDSSLTIFRLLELPC